MKGVYIDCPTKNKPIKTRMLAMMCYYGDMKKKDETGISKENELKIIDEYFANGMNGTQAVLKVMPNFSYGSARVCASRVTKKYKRIIREKKEEIADEIDPRLICSIKERKVILSEIAKGEQTGAEKVTTKDRITAIKVLNAMEGIGNGNTFTTNNYLSIEDTKKLVENKLDSVIDVEYMESENDDTGTS